MNKKKLLALIAKKNERKAALTAQAEKCEDVATLRTLNADMDTINEEIRSLQEMADGMPDDADPTPGNPAGLDENGQSLRTRIVNSEIPGIVQASAASAAIATAANQRSIDAVLSMPAITAEQQAEQRNALFSTPEYRTGFFKALAGRKDMTDTESRALTVAANSGGAAVPTTTYDMIIKRMTQTSALFGLIKKTYIAGNVTLPVANAQTAALWTDEAPTPDNDDTLSRVDLGAFALSKFAKVKGQLILMAIDALEQYIVSAISDQLAIAVENAILNGNGSSKPTGILSGVTWDATNSAEYTNALGYDDMVNAKALLGLYRSNAVWVVNGAMEAQIYKIKTSAAQPLFTQNPITGLIANPLGFPIVVDYYMPDDTVLLFNPDYYYMNINQNPTITADDSAGFLSTSRVYRGTMFLDAKPALSSAFVKLTKA